MAQKLLEEKTKLEIVWEQARERERNGEIRKEERDGEGERETESKRK
jgi:hypothetical protein